MDIHSPRQGQPDFKRVDEVPRLAIDAVTRELSETLGLELTAAIGAVGTTRLVREWSTGKRRPSREAALRAALQATRLIADTRGGKVAQRWWVGTNRHFDHRSPLEAIRENTPETRTRVVRAAVAFTTA